MAKRLKTATGSLRDVKWRRFLRAPDTLLRDELYVPALRRAVRYDRCCAYFSSRVFAAAARGFGGFIQTLCAFGEHAPKPSARLLVNEQLDPTDLAALLTTGDQSKLIEKLLKQFKTPKDALEKNRLEMLAWLVASGLLEMRVGLMRNTQGLMHAKFGIVTDGQADSLVFMGSDNETGAALTENYEELELSTSWEDKERADYYRKRFDALWEDRDENVVTLPLPEAVRLKLIKFAPKEPPQELSHDKHALATAMLWRFIAAAPYLPNGEYACDATAMVDLWPHQQRVVEDTARAFPSGRLLCDEVGMGKTIEAILILRRLLCGRGVKRALLLVPAGLLKQWQDELREKGGLLVPIWDGNLFWPDGTQEKTGAQEALTQSALLLVSREWARLEDNRQMVLSSPVWDLVLLDEAHAARRAKAEEGEFNTGNLLLQLLRELQLRRRARGILLLSATPMQTQPYEPWDLLGVLGIGGQWMVDFHDIRRYYGGVEELNRGGVLTPPLAKPIARLVASDAEFPPPPKGIPLNNGKLSEKSLLFVPKGGRSGCADWLRRGAPLGRRMHRNTRDTLRRYWKIGLLPLAPPIRNVDDVVFDYDESSAERDCYESIEAYINERFDELEREKPGKGFVMTVYRRRMASSPLALHRSLERRLEKVESVINKHWTSQSLTLEEEGIDRRDLSDAGVDDPIDPALPSNAKSAQAEKDSLKKFLAKLDALGNTDSKRDKFLAVLKDVTADGRSVLVFTEYADTLEYLRDLLRPTFGTTLGCYSGDGGQWWNGEKWVSVSKADITEKLFRKELQVLLCTDAASEGLNLQAASALINYDLPWNPSKVEQRIGRIDRIGQQQSELPIRNLFLTDSVDMRVYQALRIRCGLFEHFVGRMQPVLALARDALRRNLRHKNAASFIQELEREVERVSADGALANTFTESDAEKSPAVEPPVTRADLETALGWSEQSKSSIKVKRVKGQPRWRLTGLGKRAIEATVDRETLERDEKVIPLTVGGQLVQRIVERLGIPSRLPLVIAEHHAGNYQAGEARWVHANGVTVVTSAKQLQQLIESWDGTLPSPKLIVEAQEAARKVARRRVEAMRQTACAAEQAGLQRQLESARARLLRELARTLRCIGSGESNSLLRKQVERESRAEERYHRALELLGGYPTWTADILQDAESFIADKSAHDRQARVALPTPLDAALNDPRWIAQG